MARPAAKPLVIHIAVGGNAVGGVTQHVWCLAPHLERQGFRVEVVYLGGGFAPEEAGRRGLNAVTVSKRGRGDLLAVIRLARLLRRRRPALVHTHTLTTNFYGRWAARLARVPRCVTTVHSFMGDLLRYDPTGRLGNRLLFWQNQLTNRFADRLVAVSDGVRQWLLEAGVRPEKISLIRCGIDLDAGDAAAQRQAARARWNLGADEWVIGNVARAHPVKDQAGLLRAAAPLLRSDPAARLVIVGDGPERPRLEALARDEGLLDRVLLPGAVESARQLMAGFDVFALSSRMEGIPLALLEAMAAGRPVVATRVGGVAEVVEPEVSGILVPPGSPDALGKALSRLRADAGLADRLGAAARRAVETAYDARITSRQMADLYRELPAAPEAQPAPEVAPR